MQFLINRPSSPSSPHHREKKLLTTLNNLTFDSHTHLSVQRNSYSPVFIPLSIPTKSYICGTVFSIESIPSFERSTVAQHANIPYHLYAPSAIRDAQCRKAVAPGGCAEAKPTLKPRNEQRSTEFLRGIFTSFGALSWREMISRESPSVFRELRAANFFRRCSRPLGCCESTSVAR